LIEGGRSSGELVGFMWFLPGSDDVPNFELFEENAKDSEMLSCINMLVRTIQFNQIQAMRRPKI
jgi:hypothetical protein